MSGIADTLRRHLEAEARHDAAAAAACYVEDGSYEHVALGLRFEGRDGVHAQYAASYATFPDLSFEPDGEIAGDDRVAQWGVVRGTVKGPFLGLEPTGKRIAVPMVAIYTFRGDLIESETVYLDLATLAAQAGYELQDLRAAGVTTRPVDEVVGG